LPYSSSMRFTDSCDLTFSVFRFLKPNDFYAELGFEIFSLASC